MTKPHYVASVGNDDKERLAIQHECFAEGTADFVRRINITEGMHVLVVGCGGGDETVMIAKRVGKTGSVTAIDISNEQIEIAREKVKREKLTNITLRVLAAEDLGELVDKYDVVYCRMVLVHVSDPKIVLRLMYERVKVYGIVACEEPDISTCFSVPKSDAFIKHINLLCDFMKRSGRDPDFGSKAYQVFREIGFSDINLNFSQPAIIDKRLQLAAPMSAKSCKPQYIALGLVTELEANSIIAQIEKDIIESENTLLGQCRMMQIYGIKKDR